MPNRSSKQRLREERRNCGWHLWIAAMLREEWMLPEHSCPTLAWTATSCFNTRKGTGTTWNRLTPPGHTPRGGFRFRFWSSKEFHLGGGGRTLLFPRPPKAIFPSSPRSRWLAEWHGGFPQA